MVTHLRKLRDDEGASQTAYAARVGVSLQTYGPIESGRSTPTDKVAKLMEAAFGEPVAVLLSDTGKNVNA